MTKRDPKLVFVKHEGAFRHVSEFAHLSAGARPPVFCPNCDSPVILHLGVKNVHHSAHKPDAFCALTQPETVRHVNTKLHLHAQLSGASRLYVSQPCYGWWAPNVESVKGGHVECVGRGRRRPYLWLEGWDRVEVEMSVGRRRPDVVLYRGDVAVAAIEVRATHAVDVEKCADLEHLGLPWLEVEAGEEFYAGEEPWSPAKPLIFLECSPTLPPWTCEFCLKREERYEEDVRKSLARALEERRQRDEEARNRREHREAHERWLREEIVPRSRPAETAEPAVAWTRKVCDGEGREIAYTVRQATEESLVLLRFGDELLASFPPPYTPTVARLLTSVYRNHRRCLGPDVRDVTKWEKSAGKPS